MPLFFQITAGLTGTKARWMLFMQDKRTVEEVLGKVNIPPDCEFLVAQSSEKHVQLMEVYRVHHSFPLKVHEVGNWSKANGLQWDTTALYKRRNNLHGLAFRATVSEVRHATLITYSPDQFINITIMMYVVNILLFINM
jgi:hypothetical protein